MQIVITSPSLETDHNVSGISALTRFIIHNAPENQYIHFVLGKRDAERRDFAWLLKILGVYPKWCRLIMRDDTWIHLNLPLSVASILRDAPLIIIARLFRKRMIIHLHGGEYLMRRPMPVWMKLLLRLILSGNNPKIVLSELEGEALKDKLGIDKINVLPNCIDTTDAANFMRNYDKREPVSLLFLGRIVKDKGLDFIVEALDRLQRKGVRFTFAMAGSGPAEGEYVAKFRSLLGSSFKFLGVVSGWVKTELLKASDVFLLPSLYEGLPMALLECMSFGVVPVTTDVGSIGTVVANNRNGIILCREPSSLANELALAIERLSANPSYLKSLSINAHEHIIGNFNPAVYMNSLNELYHYD